MGANWVCCCGDEYDAKVDLDSHQKDCTQAQVYGEREALLVEVKSLKLQVGALSDALQTMVDEGSPPLDLQAMCGCEPGQDCDFHVAQVAAVRLLKANGPCTCPDTKLRGGEKDVCPSCLKKRRERKA